MLRILGVLVICCVKFHKNLSEEFRQFEISLNFYKKGINYAWTEAGLNADKFATFWRFQKIFITDSFCKWRLHTLQLAKRK